jgi:hypothetical protein
LLLYLLSIGEPVSLQRGKKIYLFSQNGVEMYDGEITGWNFQFEGKFWALADSSNQHTIDPCLSFQWFSVQKRAFIVQATSPKGGRWRRWRKEWNGGLFTMKSFDEREAKALRPVIIASILFIFVDLFSQHSVKPRRLTFPRALQEVGSLRAHLRGIGAWLSVRNGASKEGDYRCEDIR